MLYSRRGVGGWDRKGCRILCGGTELPKRMCITSGTIDVPDNCLIQCLVLPRHLTAFPCDSIQAVVTLPAFAAHNNDTSLPDICGFNGDHVEDTESHIIGMKGVQDTLDWRKRRQLEESIFI